ncbi:unnamed protein product [Rhizophagus irregularis]|nr:unnamed protein product [Rhizophagus irregularis]
MTRGKFGWWLHLDLWTRRLYNLHIFATSFWILLGDRLFSFLGYLWTRILWLVLQLFGLGVIMHFSKLDEV